MNILVIGGNRFFGRHLIKELINDGHSVTVLNRGSISDDFGDAVYRMKADRQDRESFAALVAGKKWDLIYDQVCYTAPEARAACEIFKGVTKRYVVTSSESVYDAGMEQKESNFDPKSYSFEKTFSAKENYQEAKRQMEVVFSQNADFELVIVRPSLVVGLDDYTGRLKWHLDRIHKGLPIYFPNIDAKSDFIRSDQAGHALKIIGLSTQCGPVNCTTPGAIALKELMAMCETAIGMKANLSAAEGDGSHSPYGGSEDKTMDTDILRNLGFSGEPSREWIENLVAELSRTLN